MNKVEASNAIFFDEQVKQTKLLRVIARLVGFTFVSGTASALTLVLPASAFEEGIVIGPGIIAVSWVLGLTLIINITSNEDNK
jgi:hypothetical protein